MEKTNVERKLTATRFLAWFFGIIFIMFGLLNIGERFITGLCLLLSGAILIPSIYEILHLKAKFNMSRGMRSLVAILLVGVAISSAINGSEQKVAETPVPVVFDITSVRGMDIDQVVVVFKNPTDNSEPTRLQIDNGTKEWSKGFEKDGYDLLVTYDVRTRKVKDFFVSQGTEGDQDVEHLKKVVGVIDSRNFTIDPVEAIIDPSTYTGVTFIPRD